MNTKSIFNNLGLSAVIAAAAVLSLGFNNPAYAAADDHNSSRSNKSGVTADSSGGEASSEALSETMSEIDTLLSQLEDGLAQASSLHAQLVEQNSVLSEARSASSESSADTLAQIEEARRAFETSVAPLLDAATVEAVSLHFQKIEMDWSSRAASGDSDDDGLGDAIDEMSSSLSSALAALDTCKETCTAVKASWNLKENVK